MRQREQGLRALGEPAAGEAQGDVHETDGQRGLRALGASGTGTQYKLKCRWGCQLAPWYKDPTLGTGTGTQYKWGPEEALEPPGTPRYHGCEPGQRGQRMCLCGENNRPPSSPGRGGQGVVVHLRHRLQPERQRGLGGAHRPHVRLRHNQGRQWFQALLPTGMPGITHLTEHTSPTLTGTPGTAMKEEAQVSVRPYPWTTGQHMVTYGGWGGGGRSRHRREEERKEKRGKGGVGVFSPGGISQRVRSLDEPQPFPSALRLLPSVCTPPTPTTNTPPLQP